MILITSIVLKGTFTQNKIMYTVVLAMALNEF